ncbi:hypothetical protein [Okeania sp. KiyG1]|uniref:hypothetical protein n=1 Tax=Okeania sp. KiyG1 TaxID=2720165 RepID=UPI0019241594|nr:hypothetical protein [Okeania sp. KiyG1]
MSFIADITSKSNDRPAELNDDFPRVSLALAEDGGGSYIATPYINAFFCQTLC